MRISILFVLIVSAATAAFAQGRSSALFLDGALLGDRDARGRIESPMTAGAGGAIGFRISDHFSLRFEAEVPVMHTYTFGDQSFSGTDRFRTTTFGALAAGHFQAHRRVNLAFLAGLSTAIWETRRSILFDNSSAGSGPRDYHWTSHGGALSAGVDAAVNLTPHVAIVPEVRVHTFWEFNTATRTKVAVRWTF